MPRILQAVLSPLLLVVTAAIVWAVGTALVLPQARAEEECSFVDNQRTCTQEETEGEDLCPNIDGLQASAPIGYRLDYKTGECVENSVPQVLGESVIAPDPQVLAESIGK